jgi:NADPH:quinone reductase-like Zn-dependent oxidoreductase
MVYGGSDSHETSTSPDTDQPDDNDFKIPSVSLHYQTIPTATAGHVLVKVVCAGLNPVDAKNVIDDKLPHSWTHMQEFYHDKLLAGHIIGFDFSGIVHDCPDGTFQKGDEIFGTMPSLHGTLAEYIVTPLHQVYYKSKKHSFAEAAALPLVGLTALQALSPNIQSNQEEGHDTAPSSSSTSVLIVGASGGAGHVACQVARNLGAQHVTAICSGHNVDFCKAQGATHVIDYHSTTAQFILALKAAPGCPFDVILDCVTSGDPEDSSVHHYPTLLQDRRYALINIEKHVYLRLGGATWDWFRAGLRQSTHGVLNLFWGPEELFWVRFPHSSNELKQLVEWADEDKLTVNLHQVYDFTPEAVQEGFEAMLSRRVQGKVVVQVADEN